ncbi:MAG: TonB-dependent receptor, partial [Pseudodonghicola sp.]
ALRRVEGNLFVANVDHVMDNYSLRNPSAMMGMRSPTTTDTHGGKLEGQFEFGATKARIGVDFQSNTRMAYGFMGPIAVIEAGNIANASTLSWPDVTIAQTGLYAETETELNRKTRLKLGFRYDHVKAEAGAAAGMPGYTATVPNVYYTAVYGTTFNDARTEDNFGGLIRLEHELNPGVTLFAGLSRSVRTADANERAMARGSMGVPSWVGNPDIAPEKHHQLDLGIETVRDSWSLTAAAYVDRVDDYILRDQFTTPGLTFYRNVSAQLSGVEMQASWSRGGWLVAGDATYTRGQNETDDRPLAQIPPLQGKVSLSYGQDAWRAGGRVNWAMGQDRIDPARDPGQTPGYATLDLFGSYELTENTVLLAGVDNVLDKTYANHLSRSNVFDPTVTQVNEPGRSVYLRLEARF